MLKTEKMVKCLVFAFRAKKVKTVAVQFFCERGDRRAAVAVASQAGDARDCRSNRRMLRHGAADGARHKPLPLAHSHGKRRTVPCAERKVHIERLEFRHRECFAFRLL